MTGALRSLAVTVLMISFSSAARAQSVALDPSEVELTQRLNAERVRLGLNPLQISAKLTEVADWMTNDMAAYQYIGHTDHLGRGSTERINAYGYTYDTAKGEVVAGIFTEPAEVMNAWINSPEHYDAIKNPKYRVMGVSHVRAPGTRYGDYWAVELGGYVDALLPADIGPVSYATTVNAASFQGGGAPGMIASLFGTFMNGGGEIATASVTPLPLSLLGVEVRVGGQNAGLLFVSNGQINFQIPESVAPGLTMIDVLRNGTLVSRGNLNITSNWGGIFTARATGQGAPAGQYTSGQALLPLADAAGNPIPFTPGPDSNPTYLVLYATGLRRLSGPQDLQVYIGGFQCEVTFVGPQGSFVGLDQINVKLPGALASRGTSVGGPGLTHINMVVQGAQIVNETEIIIR
ncbi:MAG TPA: CAP domain-containing protein [Blastocatellia bacterium]|nr:CAP domain-containing protein [Blastocatellia bacterium]